MATRFRPPENVNKAATKLPDSRLMLFYTSPLQP
jgi:hypothetical protein